MNAALLAARAGLVVVPELERDVLEVSGSDARSWLNALVSCDLAKLKPGEGAYGLLLTKQGKIQTDLDVVIRDSRVLVAVAPGAGEEIRATLDRYLVMEDAELTLKPELGFLRLVGPRANDAAPALLDAPSVHGSGAIDWLGVGGAAVVLQRADANDLQQRALELGGADARVADPAEWNVLRISSSFPEFGVDYGPEDNPHEASLERLAVSFSKGCYLGQEVVCMQDMRGRVKRRLVALKLPRGGAVSVGSDVRAHGSEEAVGKVTSVADSGSEILVMAKLRAPHFDSLAGLSVAGVSAEPIRV